MSQIERSLTPDELASLHQSVLGFRWYTPTRRDIRDVDEMSLEVDLNLFECMLWHEGVGDVPGAVRKRAIPVLVACVLERAIGTRLCMLLAEDRGEHISPEPAISHPMLARPLPLSLLESCYVEKPSQKDPEVVGCRSLAAMMTLSEYEKRWRFFGGVGRFAPIDPRVLLARQGYELICRGYFT